MAIIRLTSILHLSILMGLSFILIIVFIIYLLAVVWNGMRNSHCQTSSNRHIFLNFYILHHLSNHMPNPMYNNIFGLHIYN